MADKTYWTAWLIEHVKPAPEGPRYVCANKLGWIDWTTDPLKALHFVRREDAESFAYGEDCGKVSEHALGTPPAPDLLPGLREAFDIANTFSFRPDPENRIHPDIPLQDSNESARVAAHSYTIRIAHAIRARIDELENPAPAPDNRPDGATT